MDEWFVNPVIDTIYGEADATGLLDRMVLNTPIKGVGGATIDNYNTYLSMIYQSALNEFGYRIDGVLSENAGGQYLGLWVNRINKMYEEKYGVKNVFSKQQLIKFVVFFGYLLSPAPPQNLNEDLSKELDVLVEKIAGPGEKYNTKVYMNSEMFKHIITLIYDLRYADYIGSSDSLLHSTMGYDLRKINPYNEYTYPPDFFIKFEDFYPYAEWLEYPYMMGLVGKNSKTYFMNWNKTNPFDV
jgi:hypothetical protein